MKVNTEQEFVAAIHEKNHERITGWLNNLPAASRSVTAGTSSETRMPEAQGAIATDATPCELNAELLQAVVEANKERRKVYVQTVSTSSPDKVSFSLALLAVRRCAPWEEDKPFILRRIDMFLAGE